MKTRTMLAAAGIALVGTIALSGCTSALGGEATTGSNPGGKGSDAAAAFLACLKSGGVEAKINDSDQVLVKLPPKTEGGGDAGADGLISADAGEGVLAMEGDSAGNAWAAVTGAEYFADDPETQDAYAACEKQHPDFSQPKAGPENDPEVKKQMEEQQAAGMAFARCARENGFPGISDPDPATGGAVMLPDDLTEDDFRALVNECYDNVASVPFGVSEDAPFDPWKIIEEHTGEPAS